MAPAQMEADPVEVRARATHDRHPTGRTWGVRLIPVAVAIVALVVAFAVGSSPPSTGDASSLSGRIAFVRSSGRDADIFLLEPATGDVTSVTQGPGTRSAPAWSPDGDRLAFVWRRASGGGFNLYTMTSGGWTPVRLTDGLWIDGNPSWSPDGSSIAFDSNRDGGRVGVFVVGSAGGAARWIAEGQSPSWSPSGDVVALMRLEGGTYDVFTMRPDGSDVVNLTAHPSDDVEPSWAPDGRRIAFASDRGGDFDIYVLDVVDGSLEAVTAGPEDDRHPAWSPDGRSIAFARSGGEVASSALFLVELGGGRVVRMTSDLLYDLTPTWGA